MPSPEEADRLYRENHTACFRDSREQALEEKMAELSRRLTEKEAQVRNETPQTI